MDINFFGAFGLLTILIFAVVGFLLLPMWLWAVAWILKNLRAFILDFGSLCREWVESLVSATKAIFNVIIYGQYEKPKRKEQNEKA